MAQTVQEIDISTLERLTELQQDRVVLVDRIGQLNTEKENVSTVVYGRVLTDYEHRLQAIDDEAMPLRQQAAEPYGLLMHGVRKLEADLDELRLELEELELRHRIGELDEETVAEHRQNLGERETDVQQRLQEMQELRQRFLAAVDGQEETLMPKPADDSSEEGVALGEVPAPDVTEVEVMDVGETADPIVSAEEEEGDLAADESAQTDESPILDQEALPSPALEESIEPAAAPSPGEEEQSSDREQEHEHRPTLPIQYPESFAQDVAPFSGDSELGRTRLVTQPVSPLAATSMMPLASLTREPEGDNEHAEIEVFPVEPFTAIGRTADNQIQVDEISVSRHHAEIQLSHGGLYTVRDLGSANGTFVNGNTITSQDLLHGDVLQIGTVRFRFRMAGEEEDS